MTTTTATRKTAKKQDRAAKLTTVGTAQVLGLTTGKDTVFYLLTTLAATVGAGFHLAKADRGDGPGEEYDVLLDGQFSSCECMGFLRHGHCKHVEALTALVKCGKLSAHTASKPQAEPTPCDLEDL